MSVGYGNIQPDELGGEYMMAKSSNEFKHVLQVYKEQPRIPVHSFHRYFGKLIPGIPAFAIDTFTKEGDLVLDPFSGSGTTVVEARERNRESFDSFG